MNNIIYDLETPCGYFLACFYHPDEDRWYEFSINQYRNDIYKLIKYLDNNKFAYFCGYNNVNFDGQVIEFIWRNYEKWFDKSALEIAAIISQYATDVIDDTNHGVFPPYRENELTFRQLDVLRIQHFDNKNRRVGLKRLEFEMDSDEIEMMGVPVGQKEFSKEQCEELIHYCKNDVKNTYKNYLYITGETNNPIYRGTNQIKIREALSKRFKFDATNYSNSKYGDEIIKTLYCKEAGIEYGNLPKKGTFRSSVRLKSCIPKHIQFKTDQLKKFLERVRKKELLASESYEEAVHFMGQEYTFSRGGIHNVIENKQYHSDDEYLIRDVDVTSYYVATILNNELCPAHLNKKAFIKAYTWIYNERVRLKPLSKKDDEIKGVVAGYKEAGVSVYGKSGDPTNWLFDIQMMLTTCIAGQFSIMMLIEAQELAGNKCIMANTDGATFLIQRDKIDEFDKINEEWKAKTSYKLEFFDFESMWFRDVNNYIAKYIDGYNDPIMGNVKRKGIFATESELHKNKSFRVIALGLYEYFIKNKDVEQFVNEFDNIFHFCGRAVAGKKYRNTTYEGMKEIELPSLIRYYVSKNGIDIMQMVRKGVLTNATDRNVKPADRLKTMCNSLLPPSRKAHLDNIDREWYIDKIKEVVFALERGKPPKRGTKPNKNQLSIF